MKAFKSLLHIFLALASTAGFLVGWATFAHSNKPVQPGQTQVSQQDLAPLPALPSIQVDQSSQSNPLQFFAPRQSTSSLGFSQRGFFTRGS